MPLSPKPASACPTSPPDSITPKLPGTARQKEEERAAREAARQAEKDRELGIGTGDDAQLQKSALTSELLTKGMEASKHQNQDSEE